MRVKKVKYLGEYKLQLQFSDKTSKVVDFKAKLKSAKGIFLPLKDLEYFKKVAIDDCKLSICWPNGADICPDVLYDMGDDVEVIKAPKPKSKKA